MLLCEKWPASNDICLDVYWVLSLVVIMQLADIKCIWWLL